jgi:hypothetical protein
MVFLTKKFQTLLENGELDSFKIADEVAQRVDEDVARECAIEMIKILLNDECLQLVKRNSTLRERNETRQILHELERHSQESSFRRTQPRLVQTQEM